MLCLSGISFLFVAAQTQAENGTILILLFVLAHVLMLASRSSVFTLKYHFVCAGACGTVMLASLVETIHLKRFESIKLQ